MAQQNTSSWFEMRTTRRVSPSLFKMPPKPNREGKPSLLVRTGLNRYGWQEGFPLLNSPTKRNRKGFPSCWFKPAPTWTMRRRDPFSSVRNHPTKHNTKGFPSQLVRNGPKCGWQGGVALLVPVIHELGGKKKEKSNGHTWYTHTPLPGWWAWVTHG